MGTTARVTREDSIAMGQEADFAFVILGTIFLFIGIFSCAIALARRGSARKVLGWFGIFSGMYGVRLFAAVPAAFRLLVGQFASHAQQFVWIITFLIMIPALLLWAELSLATLRHFFQLMIVPASVVAVGGITPSCTSKLLLVSGLSATTSWSCPR